MEQLHISDLGFIDSLVNAREISQPFSEADIIELHNRFLTPGFHSLKVKNVQEGRSLVYTILASLNHHHNIACLGTVPIALESYVHNIYNTLKEFDAINEQALFDFFLEEFNCDFLWIEINTELVAQSWFADFEHMLNDFHIHQYVPIIMLSYEQL